jgi:hypothetical protein
MDDPPGSPLGAVSWVRNEPMEDGSRPSLALFTHPQWALRGYIHAKYIAHWVKLQRGDRLHIKGGFLQGSADAKATFAVYFRDAHANVVTWANVAHAYNGVQFEKVVDLSPWAGQRGYVMLKVFSTQEAKKADAATWTIARIERPP